MSTGHQVDYGSGPHWKCWEYMVSNLWCWYDEGKETNNVIGLYISDLKQRDLDEDIMALIFGRPIARHCVRISDQCSNVLEIDTIRAWKESNSQASWSNEVAVEVVIRWTMEAPASLVDASYQLFVSIPILFVIPCIDTLWRRHLIEKICYGWTISVMAAETNRAD